MAVEEGPSFGEELAVFVATVGSCDRLDCAVTLLGDFGFYVGDP